MNPVSRAIVNDLLWFGAIIAFLLWLSAPALAYTLNASEVLGVLRASHYNCRAKGQCSRHKITASGERFNEGAMTAAHRTLPFGTRLRVCRGKRCVVVRINDRGPYIRGRSLDLSSGAARAIGFTGVQMVSVERVR